jgi:hypothetical protein
MSTSTSTALTLTTSTTLNQIANDLSNLCWGVMGLSIADSSYSLRDEFLRLRKQKKVCKHELVQLKRLLQDLIKGSKNAGIAEKTYESFAKIYVSLCNLITSYDIKTYIA